MKNTFQRVRGFFPFLAMMIFLVGCENSKEATVEGKVTLDGIPLDCGTVAFVAGSKTDTKAAAGSVQPDGSYQVQIGQSGKLWVGEYAVKVSAREPSTPHPDGGPPTPGALITPEHYANTSTSNLNFNIRAGENIIDIALVSDPVETTVEDPEASGEEEASSATEEAPVSEEPAEEASVETPEESPAEEPAGEEPAIEVLSK